MNAANAPSFANVSLHRNATPFNPSHEKSNNLKDKFHQHQLGDTQYRSRNECVVYLPRASQLVVVNIDVTQRTAVLRGRVVALSKCCEAYLSTITIANKIVINEMRHKNAIVFFAISSNLLSISQKKDMFPTFSTLPMCFNILKSIFHWINSCFIYVHNIFIAQYHNHVIDQLSQLHSFLCKRKACYTKNTAKSPYK